MVPLVLFAFNRPNKLQAVISAIKQQTVKPDKIIAFLDGPRSDSDHAGIGACKYLLSGVADEIVERQANFGCAGNIMSGTRQVASGYEQFVVLEDDTLPARTWYEAMRWLLHRYSGDKTIGAVGAHPSILNGSLDDYPYDVILSPRFSCWGWGSWSYVWKPLYDEWRSWCEYGLHAWGPRGLPGHAGPDIAGMIESMPRSQLWDGYVAGAFLHFGLLQAIPRYYLVNNIGADLHLTGSKLEFMMKNNPIQERVPVSTPPTVRDEKVCAAVRAYVQAMGS